MNTLYRTLIFCFAIFTTLNLTAETSFSQQLQKKKAVAVLEFSNAGGMETGDMSILTNRFRNFLVMAGEYDVLERDKMRDILKEQDFQGTDDCNTSECAVQVGKLLGVEKMVAGDIGKMGQVYTIDIRMISVATGKIEHTESQNHKGEKEGLLDMIEAIAFVLSGKSAPTKSNINLVTRKETDDEVKIGTVTKKTGSLEINNEVEGILFIDGKEIGEVTPGTIIPVENMKTGKHLIEIKKENILYTLNVDVEFDRIIKISTRDMAKLSIISDKIVSYFDPRDQSMYRAVNIGNTLWMLDNLRYKGTGGSFCYNDDSVKCDSHGRLYTWEAAKKAVPDGWRLPTKEEWEQLMTVLKASGSDGNKSTGDFQSFAGAGAGWKSPEGPYNYINQFPCFWSSSESDQQSAWFCNFTNQPKSAYIKAVNKKYGFSIRCVKIQ